MHVSKKRHIAKTISYRVVSTLIGFGIMWSITGSIKIGAAFGVAELIEQTRCDAIIATGRSDYPNQVNNVLGFPYILLKYIPPLLYLIRYSFEYISMR